MRRLWVVFAILFLLVGCATAPTAKEVVVQETMTMVDIDQQYLNDCPATAPVDPLQYSAMGVDEREDALARLTISLYRDIQSCNLDKKSIREQIDKKQKLVDDFNLKQKVAADAQKGK